jgi:hypothetical protein
MPTVLEKAREYLDTLEAGRQAALALSEQKAEEAKLIKARQEGFQAAMAMLARETSSTGARSERKEPGRQRVRRPIRQLILRELSFSGRTMTVAQIAKAIDYQSVRTETALSRMEAAGQVVRSAEGRWAIGIGAMDKLNEQAGAGGNGKAPRSADGRGNGSAGE